MAAGKPASLGAADGAHERLLVEAAQRDPARFADLYENNFELVYAYIARRVGDRATAEDLTSEVFKKALENLPRFTWRGVPFAAWLLRIAANMVADRSKHTVRTVDLTDLEDAAESVQFGLEEVEQRARLFRLVDQLPSDQGRVVRLRFAEEKSIREIAQELGRTEGAVKQLQFRALENLRTQFGDKPGDENG
ncbi:MAG: sigma-70 family RNA polymerase sigma factor [Pyrinomonadaceae bacterium]|nr:sigma-70 family RNA polymerase sigma factor [Pyrinomonadaceae bacterium]